MKHQKTLAEDSVNVLVAAKINKPLAYHKGLLDAVPTAGTIVRVPLGGRTVTGIVSDAKNTDSHIKLKPISAVLTESMSIGGELLTLLSWCHRYYHSPIGQVIAAALPKSILDGKPVQPKSKRVWATNLKSDEIEAVSAPRQKAALKWLKTHGPSTSAEMVEANFGQHLIGALRKGQLIIPGETLTTDALAVDQLSGEIPQILTPAQATAIKTICTRPENNSSPFYLLDGVTGSGKTEVYLQTADVHLRNRQKVLILVPEIGLVEQTVRRVRNRFHSDVLTYHSNTAESEKILCWKKVKQDNPLVVVGTRSAIFLPFTDLSLIIVDEEQDLSYKQHEGFRYNARDVAVVRARSAGATLVLGSATPSLETLNNVSRGQFQAIYLTQRVGDRPLPNWLFCKPASREGPQPVSDDTFKTIKQHIKSGNQVLVFINRRGFAPLLQCSHCGWQARCGACDINMTLHRQPVTLICHRCDRRQAPPGRCPGCKSAHLRSLGLGTEQVESFLQSAFPNTPCFRVDRDSTQRKGSFTAKLSRLQEGKPAILVGTQMITKGHHLPGISLVVVLKSDAALLSHDFRSLEHLAQSLTQVAGRAGRGSASGQILIETSQPEHSVFKALRTTTYRTCAHQLLKTRYRQNLPPLSYSALLHANSADLELLLQFMENCRQRLAQQPENSEIDYIGPLPSPAEKRNNRFRYQIQVYSNSRSKLHTAISSVEQMLDGVKGIGKIRFGIDVDPLTMD